jgi:hypothetical protein
MHLAAGQSLLPDRGAFGEVLIVEECCWQIRAVNAAPAIDVQARDGRRIVRCGRADDHTRLTTAIAMPS